MRKLLLSLLLVGCVDPPIPTPKEPNEVVEARQCKAQCDALKQPIKYFEPGFWGHCLCGTTVPYQSDADRFCQSCSDRCAPLKVMTCKFGNDTWGAGPDVCECQKKE